MPNWCENQLSITGPHEDMVKLHGIIRISEDEFQLLEALYPTPEDLKIGDVSLVPDEKQTSNLEKHGYKSWYDWRIDKWGCKWPESSLHVSQSFTYYTHLAQIAFTFETPWGPPIEAFHKISQDWPKLLFCLYYEEPGMGFCGTSVWGNGEIQEESQSELIHRYFDEEYLYETYIANQF